MWGMILGAFCSGYAIWMYGTWLPGLPRNATPRQHREAPAWLAMIPLGCSIIGSLIGGYAVTDRLAHSGMGLVASRKVPAALRLYRRRRRSAASPPTRD